MSSRSNPRVTAFGSHGRDIQPADARRFVAFAAPDALLSNVQEPDLDDHAPEPIAWSVAQAARALGLSVDTTYKLIRAGRIPARRVGGRLLVPARRLTEWINDTAAD